MAFAPSLAAFECADVQRFSDAYLDGEFEATERILLERHLEGCTACRMVLQQLAALRTLLRARGGTPRPAPEGLRARIRAELGEVDRERLPELSFGAVAAWRRAVLPLMVGASTAGAFAGIYAVVQPARSDRWVVGDAVEVHARALPLEISTARLDQLMPLFEQHLGFPVQPPAFGGQGLLLEGGRLWHLGSHDAAYLLYGDPRHTGWVSLFIVQDAGASLQIGGARRTMLGNRQVFVSQSQGRNVVVWRNQDVVYSLVSDLGEAETLSLLGRAN